MGTYAGRMVQKTTGLEVQVYNGWSWPCFFFGPIWHLVKGLWGIGLLWVAAAIVTTGAGWLIGIFIMPFICNRQYREHLGTVGYEWKEREDFDPRTV